MTGGDDPQWPAIPAPPHPVQRHEPLPECQPKPEEEDPSAPERIRILLNAPSYRRADQDVDFLERDEAHGLRLHLDYLKPELLLQEQQVKHTIVVFGSTRISEPQAARRRYPWPNATTCGWPASAHGSRARSTAPTASSTSTRSCATS